MNTIKLTKLAAAVALTAGLLIVPLAAQAPPPQPPAQPGAAPAQPSTPVAKQPAVKSQEEANLVMMLLQSTQQSDPDVRIKAAKELLSKFPNTEFKALALFFITMSMQEKGDYEQTIAYGELTLKEDPENIQTLLLLSRLIASRTRENDLDKEEKLSTAEKYAAHAIEALKHAPRPNPSVTDEQWDEAKKEMLAQAYEAYGMIALVRNKTDLAVENFRKALEVAPPPGDPATMVRMGNALARAGKYDEAVSTFEKVMGDPNAPQQVKQIAQAERARAIQAKGAK
ncbi:MAG: tetratricopeptide repeat protein [Bryobacteraceae bacterium]